jgi:hypothetical protein
MAFKKGQSGNPAGKPKGTLSKRTLLAKQLETHMPDLITKVVELAKQGDTQALKICIDRGLPAKKVIDELVDLGKPLDGTAAEQGRLVLKAVGEGRITPDQAATLMSSIQAQARVVEIDELERRLKALEEASGLGQEE